ncbi:MAG: hypothetical protein WAW17_02260 [Rhodococcus sp. (in: high G+C Gram-positive bacteria)]|uniref:hypothetical protein n=1 Tax=Rhodococcus sp. TaxID=1831 RepID=UPI003BAEFC83
MLKPAPAGFDHPPPLVEFSQRGRIGHHGTQGPVDISFVAFAGLAAVVLVAAGGIRAKVTRPSILVHWW